MDGQCTSPQLTSAIASFHEIIDNQTESVEALETWTNDQCASSPAYQDLVSSLITPFLASYRARLLEARRTYCWASSTGSPPWPSVVWTRTSSDTVSVTGMGHEPHKRFDIRATSECGLDAIEKFLAVLTSAFEELTATEVHIARLAQLIRDLKESAVIGSAADTVQSHIRLLGQYNDAKDIGQQLIGLIAENRGVPVRSLYQDDQYGVSSND